MEESDTDNLEPITMEVYRPGTELFFVDGIGIKKFKVSTVDINNQFTSYFSQCGEEFQHYECVDTARKATAKFLELLDGKI